MIEIRELVIRATVEDSLNTNSEKAGREKKRNRPEKKDCCSESVDLLLQIIKDKKER